MHRTPKPERKAQQLNKVSSSYSNSGFINSKMDQHRRLLQCHSSAIHLPQQQQQQYQLQNQQQQQQHSDVMRTSSIKLLHNQLQTAKKELNVRSSEIVKLRASVQDLTDQIKLHPINPMNSLSTLNKPEIPQAPPSHNFKQITSSASIISNSSTATQQQQTHGPIDYYRDQVRMLQDRLAMERKQHEKDRKRWDHEKTNVLNYQNQLQDQYTNLVDAFAHQSLTGSTLSVVNNTKLV
jgi:predicted  nucleic acid-binding Zn-ribbon protein